MASLVRLLCSAGTHGGTGISAPKAASAPAAGAGRSSRLATDRRYFARPARTLFNDVRAYFRMQDQLYVWHVIDGNMRLATEFLEQLPEGVGLDGRPPQCHAHTRKGTPCQRTPLPGRDYCPSHKHLEETFESVEIPVGASEAVDGELGSLAAA